MKLKCGPSVGARRQVATDEATAKVLQLREWRDKFLWWPVRFSETDCRWLEVVEVRYPDARKKVLVADLAFNDPHATGVRKNAPEYRTKDSDSTTEVK